MSRWKANESVIYFHVLDLSTTSSGLPPLESHSQTKESWNQRKRAVLLLILITLWNKENLKKENLCLNISVSKSAKILQTSLYCHIPCSGVLLDMLGWGCRLRGLRRTEDLTLVGYIAGKVAYWCRIWFRFNWDLRNEHGLQKVWLSITQGSQ